MFLVKILQTEELVNKLLGSRDMNQLSFTVWSPILALLLNVLYRGGGEKFLNFLRSTL